MKKIALILTAIGVLFVGAGVSSPAAAYPPGTTVNLTLTQQVGPPGFTFTAVVRGCFPGERVDFRLADGAVTTVICSTTTFQASLTFTAPPNGGTYPVTATLRGVAGSTTPNRPLVLSSSVLVEAAATTTVQPGGNLPATGSSGISGNLALGGVALLVGFGLARGRRHPPPRLRRPQRPADGPLRRSGDVEPFVAEVDHALIGIADHLTAGGNFELEVLGHLHQALAGGSQFACRLRHRTPQLFDDLVELAPTRLALRLELDELRPAALEHGIGLDPGRQQRLVGFGPSCIEPGERILPGVLETGLGVLSHLCGVRLGSSHGVGGDPLGLVQHVECGPFARLALGQPCFQPAHVLGDTPEVAVDLERVVALSPPDREALADNAAA